MTNLAHQFAVERYGSVEQAKAEFDTTCIEFAGELEAVIGGRLIWFDTVNNPRWRYHCAVEVDGLVHDLWTDTPMPKEDFAKHVGATNYEYTT